MGCKQGKTTQSGDRTVSINGGACLTAEIFEQNKDKVLEKYQCPIMWGVLNEPVRAQCGHIFCSGCINTALEVDSRRRCPVCRQDIVNLEHESKIKKEIEILKVKCVHDGCKWTGNYKKLAKHVKRGHKHKVLKCLRCTETFKSSKDLVNHKLQGCSLSLSREILHTQSSLPKLPTESI